MSQLNFGFWWEADSSCEECRVIFDDALQFLVAEAQLLEIFSGNAGVAQGWVTSEPEPPIIGGVAQDNTSPRMERSDTIQAGFDQRPTNAATLFVGAHGNRAEPIPVKRLCAGLHRGKGDVPYKLAFVLCDKRHGQSATLSETVDD